jgi:hypothetical protein
MNENDLRDCFAMFALNGILSCENNDTLPYDVIASNAFSLADAMMEARKLKEKDDEHDEDVGIARVAPKRNYRRKS